MINGNRNKELALLEQAAVNILNIVKELKRADLVPMSFIMSKVPGETIAEKVANVGVSRQTYYFWVQGRSRPSRIQAERLAKLTGIPVSDIRTTAENAE
jgi:DNA-binding XRE family transcriptional regulator